MVVLLLVKQPRCLDQEVNAGSPPQKSHFDQKPQVGTVGRLEDPFISNRPTDREIVAVGQMAKNSGTNAQQRMPREAGESSLPDPHPFVLEGILGRCKADQDTGRGAQSSQN